MRHTAKILGSGTAATLIAAILLATGGQECARAAETITYSYDAKGRLTKADRTGTVNNGISTAIAFDKANNRTNYTITNGGGGGGGTILIPTSYSASSNYQSYTGLSGTGAGMRDSAYNTASTIHGTNNEASAWIQMDLGSSKSVDKVVLVPADASAPGSWGYTYLNGATLERSADGTNWTSVGTVTSSADGVPVQVTIGTSTRFLRIRKSSNYVGVGDFYATAP